MGPADSLHDRRRFRLGLRGDWGAVVRQRILVDMISSVEIRVSFTCALLNLCCRVGSGLRDGLSIRSEIKLVEYIYDWPHECDNEERTVQ